MVPAEGADSLAALNDFTRRLWHQLDANGSDEMGQHPFLLSRTEVDVVQYRMLLERMLGSDRLAEPDADSVLLLRAFATNPFLRDWCERTPAFQDLLCDHVERAVAAAFRSQS
jgi:hypothetical protein